MKNLIKVIAFLLIPAFVLTSCKDNSSEPALSEFEVLTAYMAQQNLDLSNVLDGWVKSGSSININTADFSVPDYYVIDLRSADDYNAGHIKDAHNTTMANVLDEADKAGTTPLLVVCYTGQTAARATGLLRLMGHTAYTLKWGMSGWHANFAGKWNSNAVDYSSANWVDTDDERTLGDFSEPVINTGEKDGAAILEAQVQAALDNSWSISKTDVLDNPSNYFVNNKWSLANYVLFGHVANAYRIDEQMSLANLNYLDPTATIVTYCYTGQTSAITNAWLDVLGYNTKSMSFGANAIIHTQLVNSDATKKSAWKGEGSGSENNFGYYDSEGNLHGPN
ncbi:MAG: rhodanese-like domain-containing protein [Phaeodactylibacter sp.]|nr:rhodanese-like domain-containing protein [Phaeodactylibacter sp.]